MQELEDQLLNLTEVDIPTSFNQPMIKFLDWKAKTMDLEAKPQEFNQK